ncbi:MAG: hypothetical protein Pg6B_01250 [Candidatus Azobacteroides pseudotrichonymphae]|jgi:hypothetical protein|nr:MAG: hypothetical protein Pg6B_01250 [Candidatus Azobacteroides pseudotrichonymphae]
MTTTFFGSFLGTICGMIIWHYIKVGKFHEHREQFDAFKTTLNREIEWIKNNLTKILSNQNKWCNKEDK